MPAETTPIVPHAASARSTRTSTVVAILLACVAGALLIAGALFLALFLFLGVSVESARPAAPAPAEQVAPPGGR